MTAEKLVRVSFNFVNISSLAVFSSILSMHDKDDLRINILKFCCNQVPIARLLFQSILVFRRHDAVQRRSHCLQRPWPKQSYFASVKSWERFVLICYTLFPHKNQLNWSSDYVLFYKTQPCRCSGFLLVIFSKFWGLLLSLYSKSSPGHVKNLP